jgi:hypothetical protein
MLSERHQVSWLSPAFGNRKLVSKSQNENCCADDVAPYLKDLPYQDLTRMALFDHITGNCDRHGGNWIVDKNNRVYAIDNGLAFLERTNSISDHMAQIQSQNQQTPVRALRPKAST